MEGHRRDQGELGTTEYNTTAHVRRLGEPGESKERDGGGTIQT